MIHRKYQVVPKKKTRSQSENAKTKDRNFANTKTRMSESTKECFSIFPAAMSLQSPHVRFLAKHL